MQGLVTEIGCGKCVVRIESRAYECDFNELTEPIALSIYRMVESSLKWLIKANRFLFNQ